jgi:hypothetical protein
MSEEMEVMIKRVGLLLNGGVDAIMDVAAMEVERKAKANALSKGGRHFWVSEIVNSIHTETMGRNRVVGSTHVAAAHKQYGGPISAPGKGEGALGRQVLTIPVGKAKTNRWDTDKAQAAGYDLFKIKGKAGRGLLFGRRTRGKSNRSRNKDELLFVLRKSVMQAPDKWFPQGAELEDAVRNGIDLYMSTRGGL